jgi:CRISPR/Cas system CSM-associated protein Csm3 (group 7 of RAMP superfamily)
MYRNKDQAYQFKNRYRITGTLTALAPMHAGDGDVGDFNKRLSETGARRDLTSDAVSAEYNTVSTGLLGTEARARIPGSTLKGVLRSWAVRHGVAEDSINCIFGKMASGGKACFCDAYLRDYGPGTHNDRWWHPQRGTCLAPGVSLNPKTRTAAEHLLYYNEFVPEQSTFGVEIVAQDLSIEEWRSLVGILERAFSVDTDANVATIGGETADGWGRCSFQIDRVEVIERRDVENWLSNPDEPCPWRETTKPVPGIVGGTTGGRVVFDIEIQFQGGFLVNDPSQFRRRDEKRGTEGVGHAAIRRRDGRYFLPSSSVRGSLRGQARRIWQTLANGTNAEVPDVVPEVKTRDELKNLHGFLRMVGAPGWRTPVAVSDFEVIGTPVRVRQEFVAVDRFTGGAADDKKFSADALWKPKVKGEVRIDVDAWQRAQVGGWGWMLLLFVFRDLMEGDVTFGFGRSKGYGACVAVVSAAAVGDVAGVDVELLNGVLDRSGLNAPALDEWFAALGAVTCGT